ncbi:MAG: histidinol-phosphate transaminase [Cyanobacteriota bacterium]
MTSSIVDITSQRLKKLRVFLEHLNSHPIHLESSLKLEREAVYKPLSTELHSVVSDLIENNLFHHYPEDYFTKLKINLADYLNIKGFSSENLFVASNLYNFYEYLTELFLQKDQKVLLYTSDEFDYTQEVKYINSGRVVIEHLQPKVGNISEIHREINNEDYKIVIVCSQNFDQNELTDLVDLLPENIILVLRTSNPVAFNYINHGNKTVLVLREFPPTMTIVEPPISFVVARKEVVNLLDQLQNFNSLDILTIFFASYYTSLDNPVDYSIKSSKRPSEGYNDILMNIVRENIESLTTKNNIYNKFNVAEKLKIPLNEVIDYSNGNHFLGISEDLKEALVKFIDSQERYNYYSQRTLLRNMLANEVSLMSKKFHYNNIHIGAGVSGLLETVSRAFINDGEGYKKLYKDKALILDCSPDLYTRVVEKRDAYVEKISLNAGMVFDVDDIIKKIYQTKPKLIIIDNPRIFVGTYFDKEQLVKLLENVPEYSIIVIDETYFKFAEYENDDFDTALSYVDRHPNLIVLRSFSQSHALAGIRLGYAIAQESIINCLDAVRHPFDVSPFALHLGIKILQGTDIFEKVTQKFIQEQKSSLYQYLSEMGLFYIKSSTNSITFSTVLDSNELQERLLPYKILIHPLDKNFVRFSIKDQNKNIYFIKSLKMAMGSDLHN